MVRVVDRGPLEEVAATEELAPELVPDLSARKDKGQLHYRFKTRKGPLASTWSTNIDVRSLTPKQG